MQKKYIKTVEFIRKIYGTNEFIPLHVPVFLGNEKQYLNECIDSTFISYVGKFVVQFEEKIAEYCGSKYAIAVVNGTVALQIALISTGIESGEEVITQPLTFIATSNAIKHAGASPVFVDVDKETLGLSPEKLLDFLNKKTKLRHDGLFNKTTGKRIRTCVPVHVFGHPCRIDEIKEICDNYKLILIEDAAESIGSTYKNKHTGTYGKCGILSFNGNKTISTGGGGMIITDDESIALKVKHLTTTAKVPHPWEYIHDEVGFNFRMPNINAAVGVAQIEKIDAIIDVKRKIAEKYKTFFNSLNITYVSEPTNSFSNYWLNAILLNSAQEKETFLKFVNENNVMTRPVWRLTHELEMYKNCQRGNLDNSKWLQERLVNLPSSVSKKFIL